MFDTGKGCILLAWHPCNQLSAEREQFTNFSTIAPVSAYSQVTPKEQREEICGRGKSSLERRHALSASGTMKRENSEVERGEQIQKVLNRIPVVRRSRNVKGVRRVGQGQVGSARSR